jgi:hypothetical protein
MLLQMWPDLFQKSKDGGLDVIETYVFWNLHEPVRNQVSLLLFHFLSYLLYAVSAFGKFLEASILLVGENVGRITQVKLLNKLNQLKKI